MISTGIIFYRKGKEGLWDRWFGCEFMWLGGSEQRKRLKLGQDQDVRGVMGVNSWKGDREEVIYVHFLVGTSQRVSRG